MKQNKAFKRLASIPSTIMTMADLTPESKAKIKDTVKYAMEANNESDLSSVVTRCMIAQLAEQYVAEWMEGEVMHGDEDLNDPWTYAFDVVSGPKYYGMRLEVKTHQSESNYITINTGHAEPFKGKSGLNLRPFIEHKCADLIIIFNTKTTSSGVLIEPVLLSDRDSLIAPGVIVKSKFDGYYINRFMKKVEKDLLNVVYF